MRHHHWPFVTVLFERIVTKFFKYRTFGYQGSLRAVTIRQENAKYWSNLLCLTATFLKVRLAFYSVTCCLYDKPLLAVQRRD